MGCNKTSIRHQKIMLFLDKEIQILHGLGIDFGEIFKIMNNLRELRGRINSTSFNYTPYPIPLLLTD